MTYPILSEDSPLPAMPGAVTEWSYGNVYIRKMPHRLDKAGAKVLAHAHNFDHVTICMRGSIRITVQAKRGPVSVDLRAADADGDEHCCCLIRAGLEHEIEALADDSIAWCIYSHRNPLGEIVQEITGWPKAYI